MSLSSYRKFLVSQAAPLPLTAAEEELKQIKLSEVQTHTGSDEPPICFSKRAPEQERSR